MKDEYLWSGSGDPDPDVAELEELLSGLGFERNRTSCPVPTNRGFGRSSFRFPTAIAAALALVALSGAVLLFSRTGARDGLTISPLPSNEVAAAPPSIVDLGPAAPTLSASPGSPRIWPTRKSNAWSRRGTVRSNSTLVARKSAQSPVDRMEGELAKDELLLAMRIASAKLNMAQKIISVNKVKGRSS
jgi:hypothetical protein